MNTNYDIYYAIVGNEKRINKLRSCRTYRKRVEKAKGYIVAEAARQKVKLSCDELFSTTVKLVRAV